jgi:hypothetical protein
LYRYGEAIAAAAALALAAPEGATVIAPSALFASALTFDLATLGANGRLLSVGLLHHSRVSDWLHGPRTGFHHPTGVLTAKIT